MTKVFLERDGNRYTVSCKDHADTPEACAAISILCFTLAGYLHNIPCEIEEERLEPGDVRICYRCSENEGTAGRAAFEMISIGFLQLAESYPDIARVTVQNIG